MVKQILSIYEYFSKRKLQLFSLLTVLVILLVYSSSRISFKEDISAFLPKGGDTDRINYAYQHIGSANKLLVFVGATDTAASTDRELIMEAITHFAEQLQQADTHHLYFKKIEYQVDQQQILAVSQFLVKNMPYFLTETDYIRIDSILTEEHVRLQMSHNKRMLMSPVGMVMKQNIMADPLHWSAPLLAGLRDFQVSNQFQLYNDFIFSSDRKEGIVIIESQYSMNETRKNAELLRLIDTAAAHTQLEFDQKIEIDYFGAVDISVTNANRIKHDTFLSSIIAIVLILCILIYAFRSTKNLLLMLFSLLFGWLFAIGLLSVLRSEVSIIAVGISSVIIGIAVNYPLHLIMNHKHEHHIPNVIKNVVIPLTIGNLTTVGAFLSLLFISSNAMHDLGLFAALLLAGTIVFVLIFLPHLLRKSAKVNPNFDEKKLLFGKILSWKTKKNRWFVWIFLTLTILFCILSFYTQFETDMHRINYMTKTQKDGLEKLISNFEQGEQTIYFISTGEKLDDALTAYEISKIKLDNLLIEGAFSKINSVGVYLPSKAMQQKRLERWKSFCENKKELLAKIDQIGMEAGFKSGAFIHFQEIINKNYEIQEIDYFTPITSSLANNLIVSDGDNNMVMTILHTPRTDLDTLEARLNTINPHSFSFDTGTIGRSMINTLSSDFDMVLLICGFIVFVFLFFTLGRLELTLLAFLPLTISWFWILGMMNIFDIRFNIVNIILATFIFGMGDDYTIFMTEGLMYEYTYKRKMLASYKNTILLSALIMFIGIGSLILAQHPALRSLAEVTMVGMGSVVLMAFLLPPVIFRWLIMNKGRKRLMPVTVVNLFSSIIVFFVFAFGSMIISITGFFLFTFGKTTEKKKLRYHRLLCWVARFVIVRIPNVKTTYNKYDKNIFDKPAVIICNHQSHIDLMCIMSLTPKLIILTNDWVWNSPFYGRVIKYADFYPVSNGIENAMDKLKNMVNKGYSIMIFPESTRSEDCSIQRFHRGAFYLAEQFKLEILPVLIHGVGHILPKKEFMLRKGEIHINVMPRLDFNAMGESIGERARNIRKFYIGEYAKLTAEIETPDYFSDLVLKNYIYKGPSVERIVRKNLKNNNNYKELMGKLAGSKRVLIMNCGYGELPLLFSLVHKNIEIVATDNNQDALDLAENCMSVPSNLHYESSVDFTEIDQFDAVVLIKPAEEMIKMICNNNNRNVCVLN